MYREFHLCYMRLLAKLDHILIVFNPGVCRCAPLNLCITRSPGPERDIILYVLQIVPQCETVA